MPTVPEALEVARQFVATSTMRVTLFDMDMRMLAQSAAASSLVPAGLRGPEHWRALSDALPEALPKLADIYRRLGAGEPLVCTDDEIRTPDGTMRVLRSVCSYWRGPDGEPLAVLSCYQDMTAEVQAEEAGRAQRMQLQAVVDNLPAQIALVDLDSRRILMLNDRISGGVATYTGISAGGALDEMLSPARRANFEALVAETERADGPTESELVYNDGPLAGRVLRTKRVIFEDEQGRRQLLWIAEDVTELRESAEALRRAAIEAETANRAKSEFLANMSHEIRTPLNGVMGISGALARTSLSAEQHEMVALIGTSAKTLETLLSDILDLARIEAGKFEIRPEPFDLAESVNACGDLFAAAAQAKDLELTVHVTPEAQGAYIGDAARLRQILCNLIGNAVKFTAQGRVTLTVDALAQTGANAALSFQVSDTGAGFDAETKSRLFCRFEQADGSITRRFGGSGLGLAICRSLAEAMGGRLDAEGTPGEGAVFTLMLELPRRESLKLAGDPEPEPPTQSLAGVRVLLAEDHPINRKVVELILGAAGVQLTMVEDGVEAVKTFKTSAFDVVLMDMQMPLMDGLTATASIRRLEDQAGASRTPILVLSANAMPEHVSGSLASGADGHIAKPIGAEELLRQVANVVHAHRLSRDSSSAQERRGSKESAGSKLVRRHGGNHRGRTSNASGR